jgi:hypothetical protein
MHLKVQVSFEIQEIFYTEVNGFSKVQKLHLFYGLPSCIDICTNYITINNPLTNMYYFIYLPTFCLPKLSVAQIM